MQKEDEDDANWRSVQYPSVRAGFPPAPSSPRTPVPPPLTPLELAAGMPLGPGEPVALPRGVGRSAAALRAAILPALMRPPCVVSFSGGRDSSAVLALATAVAIEERLPLPVPVTTRFAGAEDAQENAWQERVIAHLGPLDWQRVELRDELDAVGPVAAAVLRRHGVLWPPNTHFHAPLLALARGGSLLTGIGGDASLAAIAADHDVAIATRSSRPRSSPPSLGGRGSRAARRGCGRSSPTIFPATC